MPPTFLADLAEPGLDLAIAAMVASILYRRRRNDAPGADEGYLWYGSLRVLEGELPHRDFRSYEPARYYWVALFLRILGRGLPAVRVATHAFLAIALVAVLFRLRALGFDLAM